MHIIFYDFFGDFHQRHGQRTRDAGLRWMPAASNWSNWKYKMEACALQWTHYGQYDDDVIMMTMIFFWLLIYNFSFS